MSWWWSYLLTAVGVLGLYLAGKKDRRGWVVGMGAQLLWFAYAISTRQWGFIGSCVAYGSVYTRNFLAWRREALREDDASLCSTNDRSGSTMGTSDAGSSALGTGKVKPEWVPLRLLSTRKRGGKE